jgi:hypothetical protein
MLLSGPHILFILCRVRWRWLRPGQTLGHGAYAFLDALFFWHGFGESDAFTEAEAHFKLFEVSYSIVSFAIIGLGLGIKLPHEFRSK